MHFNKGFKNYSDIYSDPRTSDSGIIAVDTARIDDHSRFTVKKKLRFFLPVQNGDLVAAYRNIKNESFILKIQRDNKIIKSFVLTEIKESISEEISELSLEHADKNYIDKDSDSARPEIDNNMAKRVMIIDDDEDVLFVFRRVLSTLNYNIETFSDGKQAIKRYIDTYPNFFDLVIIDIKMSDLPGTKIYSILKSIDKNIKILFISALDAADILINTIPDMDETQFIRKPIQNNKLIDKINSVLLK